jgi:glycosyltransferase involved in cell wall biosynthesis
MNPEISIVVPIYQVEQYIENCMISICNQTFESYEIVLVNDGSKDESLRIAENVLFKNGMQYIVLHQDNRGLSAARNKGIKAANGKWIVCVDSDDVINKHFLKVLYNGTINKNIDLSIVNFKSVTLDNLFLDSKIYIKTEVITNDEIMKLFLYRKYKIIVPAMLFRKKLIEAENLYFNELIRFSEDQEFIWRILFKIKLCAYNESMLYNYLSRENSIMGASSIENIMTGYNGIKVMLNQLDKYSEKNIIDKIMCRWVLGSLHSASKMMNYEDFKSLAIKMNYRNYVRNLFFFNDYRVKLLACVLSINLKSFYKILKWRPSQGQFFL